MNNLNLKFIVSAFLCLLISQIGVAQLSKTHYIPPLTSAEFGNAYPEDQYIYISTPKTHDVIFTITPNDGTAFTGIVSNTTPYVHHIGFGDSQLFVSSNSTSRRTTDKGYIIEAEDVIYVSLRMEAGGAQAGALVSKGTSALDTVFRIGSYTNEDAQVNNWNNYLNFVFLCFFLLIFLGRHPLCGNEKL